MPEREILSQNIKRFRRLQQESQIEFSDNVGISVEMLGAIERMSANPSLLILQKIAAYTGVTVSELLRIEDENGEQDD